MWRSGACRYNKAVRKNILLDAERTAIFERFEQQGIWYMPLKGSILKELYPENGMREMADNDILYDSTKQAEVKKIMLSMGYSAESVGKSHHDVYMKPPVLNFELHTLLFGAASDALFRGISGYAEFRFDAVDQFSVITPIRFTDNPVKAA